MAGANQIYGAGMIESGVTFDFGQLVMDDEFAGTIKHAVAGIPVNDGALAVDDIAGVGPFGDFLSLGSTLLHMRGLSQPTLLDRRVREDREARGAIQLGDRCRARALEIVRCHEPEAVDADVAAEVRAVVVAADRELGVG